MNERTAFYRAIAANPEDDDLRQVFADWLDDRDDPQGTFIRLQYELEKHPPVPILQQLVTDGSELDPTPNYVVRGHRYEGWGAELFKRCETLFREGWFAELAASPLVRLRLYHPDVRPQPQYYNLTLRRGFPEILECLESDFLFDHFARWLVDTCPLRQVRYIDKRPRRTRHRSGGMSSRYTWWQSGEGGPPESSLNTVLMPNPSRRRNNYSTEAAAFEAASRRALEYARTAPPPIVGPGT